MTVLRNVALLRGSSKLIACRSVATRLLSASTGTHGNLLGESGLWGSPGTRWMVVSLLPTMKIIREPIGNVNSIRMVSSPVWN